MPLTPTGHGGPLDSASPKLAFGLGIIAVIGGIIVSVTGTDLWGGFMILGFGGLLVTTGAMMSERFQSPVQSRLLVCLGLLAGVIAFGSAVMVLR